MIHTTSLTLAALHVGSGLPTIRERFGGIILLTLWVSGFLFLLNVGLAAFFRKRRRLEVLSYCIAATFELVIFCFALILLLLPITEIPYPLPLGLPVNRAQIGAALTIGIGMFPAGYWHRVNVSELPKRIADDAKSMKERDAAVRVRNSAPGEWMN